MSTVSILDQVLISGSNFLLSVMLARWLAPEEYGYYGIVYAVFLLLVWLHSALVLEPLTVFGSGRYLDQIQAYFRANLKLNTWLTIVLSSSLVVTGLIAGADGALTNPFLSVALSLPLIFLYWFFRRECYVLGQPSLALIGGVLYFLGILSGGVLFYATGLISASAALILLGVASILPALVLSVMIRRKVSPHEETQAPVELSEVLGLHWEYGRWVVATGVVYWLVNLMYVPVVGLILGLEKAGLFKAFQTLFLPIEHILTALGLLLLPRLSIMAIRKGKDSVLRMAGNSQRRGCSRCWFLQSRDLIHWWDCSFITISASVL